MFIVYFTLFELSIYIYIYITKKNKIIFVIILILIDNKVFFLMILRKLFLILCNKGTKVILYKLHFLSSYFFSQPNK